MAAAAVSAPDTILRREEFTKLSGRGTGLHPPVGPSLVYLGLDFWDGIP